ncbi:orexin receptor type 2 [Echinococcus multilocularis]|uniref:Orexin receptor type 2 n=1 Tax=Echinococcus multilocularis TaxID=6211 RepID=A0A068Y9W8_ECHMU|nr:orexin receptor type 2 [Echinococcus multilocularis]
METLTSQRITEMNNTPSNSAIFSDVEVFHAIAVMVAVIVIGSIGNTLVISVLCLKNFSVNSRWNQYRRRNQFNIPENSETGAFDRDKTLDFFILVLAVSDLLVCVVIIPSTITMEIHQFRISVDVLCKLFYVLFVTNTTFSSLLISAVALDRYLFICHSLKHILTLIRAKILVSTLALFSLCVGIAAGSVVGVKAIHHNATEDNVTTNYICEENEYVREISELQKTVSQIIKYLNHACYLACILIVLILYSCVFWAIVTSRSRSQKLTMSSQKSRQNGRNSSLTGKSTANSRMSRQRIANLPAKLRQKAQFTLQNLRSALMLFIIALVYILTFVPSLVIANGWAPQNLVLLYLYYVNSAANPCIYAIFTPSFRQMVAVLFRNCFCKGRSTQPPISGRNSKRSDPVATINAGVSHTNSRAFSRMGRKKRPIEEAYPFISREERMAAAAAAAAASTATPTVSNNESNMDASDF